MPPPLGGAAALRMRRGRRTQILAEFDFFLFALLRHWIPATAGASVSSGGAVESQVGAGPRRRHWEDWLSSLETRRRRGHAAITDGSCWYFQWFLLNPPPSWPRLRPPITTTTAPSYLSSLVAAAPTTMIYLFNPEALFVLLMCRNFIR